MPVVLKASKDDAPLEQDTGSCSEEEVSMSEKATEQKAPETEVVVKKAPPKAKPKQDAKPSAATVKLLEQLEELSKEIQRIESLKGDRTALIAKLTAAKVPTATIAEKAGLSVPRLRQVQQKAK
jgi:hypothetical protein